MGQTDAVVTTESRAMPRAVAHDRTLGVGPAVIGADDRWVPPQTQPIETDEEVAVLAEEEPGLEPRTDRMVLLWLMMAIAAVLWVWIASVVIRAVL